MRIKEQYKHLLNYSANLISLAVEGAAFAFIWYNVYEDSYGFFAEETGRLSVYMY